MQEKEHERSALSTCLHAASCSAAAVALLLVCCQPLAFLRASQLVALLYYTMSYFPGGTQGAKLMVSAIGSAVTSCFGRLFK